MFWKKHECPKQKCEHVWKEDFEGILKSDYPQHIFDNYTGKSSMEPAHKETLIKIWFCTKCGEFERFVQAAY